MKFKFVVFLFVTIGLTFSVSGQKSATYTNSLYEYNQALELFQNKSYAAAQYRFEELKSELDDSNELKGNCEFYAANCAIRLGQRNADDRMLEFVEKNPTNTKQNNAYLDVAEYYFSQGKFPFAAKWYDKVNTTNLSFLEEEDYYFKYGYSLFSAKNYSKAKQYFQQILDSPEYGAQAKYYYGYIAYNQDDYATANKYLEDVSEDANYKTKVSYYLTDMNFKLGNFQKAIDNGIPLLETAKGTEHSEISKIIGESYFNLEQYEQAIPFLQNYKGKRGKWNNTDYYLLGYAFYKQQNYEEAIGYFNKIINGQNAVAQNAYYHLGECYLKQDQKQEALNAFRNATQLKFSPEIQKDAWLNYAKLSYDIGNPYKSVPEVLQEYIELYPKEVAQNNIDELMINAYISSKDYEGALAFIEKHNKSENSELYQEVSLYYGLELFTDRSYRKALPYLQNASQGQNATIKSKALYWVGETNFVLNNFIEAQSNFNAFKNQSNARSLEEYGSVHYNLGYTYFKQKEYNLASESFRNFINTRPNDPNRINDSYLRIADAYFVTSNYSDAINYYDRVLDAPNTKKDYALFQKAISYGLLGQDNLRVRTLNSFIDQYDRSVYLDDAYYVLGNSYTKLGQNRDAISSYDRMILRYPKSPLVSKAMLKKGLIYYNSDQNNEALSTYKKVVSQFPNTAEAEEAVRNARQIYVDQGNVDAYAAWVQNLDFVNITNADLDNDTFEAAEKQYLQNNHKRAITAFQKYVQQFPNGIHSLPANYYLAQSLFNEERYTEAQPKYHYVIDQQQNEYTENSLARLSVIYLEKEDWDSAIPILERLESESNSEDNTTFAQSNLMKGYFSQENYDKASSYANRVLNNPKIDDRVTADAKTIIARTAIIDNKMEVARTAYEEVATIASGELKAESLYYKAYFENYDGSYRVSNATIQEIIADYASYKYWSAKGLVLMADNFYNLKDAFQATYILESIEKNFSQFEDVVTEANEKLAAIKAEEAKTNESVNVNDGN